ncbi:MAG: YdcF family protein [Alphaproteobacteria bacterium]|nr:YdcF family protein [Alphaproteobacteria bacterium]
MNAARRRGGLLSWIRFLGLLLVVPGAAYVAGLVWFAESIPRAIGDDGSTTDAIVVLTGGVARVRTGLELLSQGRARKLFVSGVYRGVDVQELLRAQKQAPEALECCIVLGYSAETTEGNAAETKLWIEKEHYRSLRLVTASYHMPRSLLEFRRALPELRIVPHPVAPEAFRREAWWAWPGTLQLVVSEYHKMIAALLRPYLGSPR